MKKALEDSTKLYDNHNKKTALDFTPLKEDNLFDAVRDYYSKRLFD